MSVPHVATRACDARPGRMTSVMQAVAKADARPRVLRIGWLVVPPALVDAVTEEKILADRGTGRIEQHAFADFLTRGELDRHLRRMRVRYRARRDALIEAIGEELPEAIVRGIAAGLHALVELPESDDEQAIRDEMRGHRIHLATMSDYWPLDDSRPPTLMLGYAKMSEPTIRAGVGEIAEAVRAAR